MILLLYGCETGSLTLREERRLKMIENRELRKIFWPKRMRYYGIKVKYIMRS
jgi:hypothetical protein